MADYLPGTALEVPVALGANALLPLLQVTKGLTLAQVREITGLEASTIQNWVKRGWVANPKGKRYDHQQVFRIVLINVMRDALQLDAIAQLMTYINGDVEDTGDDIIPDEQLYDALCQTIVACDGDTKAIEQAVAKVVSQYALPEKTAYDRLCTALTVMTKAYFVSKLQAQAQSLFIKEIKGE